MARVYIPQPARDLSGGIEQLEVDATSVRRLIDALEELYPGFRNRVLEEGELKPGMRVAIDGHISSLGLLAKLDPDSEVHFLPAIGGG